MSLRSKSYKNLPTGPSTKILRVAHEILPEKVFARPFQDLPVHRSKLGKMGRIVVNRYSGVVRNSAVRTIMQFEKNLDHDKDAMAMYLENCPGAPKEIQALTKIIRENLNTNKSLAHMIAEAKADPAKVIQCIWKGMLETGQMEAKAMAALGMPGIVREMLRQVTPKETMCNTCLGIGKVAREGKSTKQNQVCPECGGTGKTVEFSEHFKYASEYVRDTAGMSPKTGGPSVLVQQNMRVGESQGLLAGISRLRDDLLFNRMEEAKALPAPVDAEIVDVQS